MQKCQQDAHRLLLVPGKHHGKRKFIDSAVESLCKRDCHFDGSVGIVTLSHIHDPRETADASEIQIVEPVFSTRQCKNNRICRCLFYEFRIIVSAFFCSVAAADQKEMPDRSCLYRIHDLICCLQDRSVSETGGQLFSTVNSLILPVFPKSSKFQCLFDHRCEIFSVIYMYHTRIRNYFRGKDAVCVALLRWHQTVGRKQDGSRKISKFFLLVLPCRSEVSFQMTVFFQFRVCVCRKHLAMGIDIDALSFGLFQKQLQITQIVTGNHDKRPFFHFQRNLCRFRDSVSLCVGTIQQFHTGQINFSRLQNHREKFFHAKIHRQRSQCFI